AVCEDRSGLSWWLGRARGGGLPRVHFSAAVLVVAFGGGPAGRLPWGRLSHTSSHAPCTSPFSRAPGTHSPPHALTFVQGPLIDPAPSVTQVLGLPLYTDQRRQARDRGRQCGPSALRHGTSAVNCGTYADNCVPAAAKHLTPPLLARAKVRPR